MFAVLCNNIAHLNYNSHDLGIWHLEGMGVEADEKTGFNWLLKAAEKGFPNSQFINELGVGVALDYEKAYDWFAKAALYGEPNAIMKLMEEVNWDNQ